MAAAPRLEMVRFAGVAFVGGFAIMALEMCGFRVLTTELGSSVVTTGTLLSVIMVALAAGYARGGRAARADTSYLFLWVVASGAYVLLIDQALGAWVVSAAFALRGQLTAYPALRGVVPAALITTALYVPPMAALAQITPWLVGASARRAAGGAAPGGGAGGEAGGAALGGAGGAAGAFMALSTAGSIAGTLATSYGLIPLLGLRRTLTLLGVGLMLAGLAAGAHRARPLAVRGGSAMALLLFFVGEPALRPAREPGLIHEEETPYGTVRVYEEVEEDGERTRVFKPERDYEHSRVWLASPLKDQLGLSYLTPGLAAGAESYLVLGTAGGGTLLEIAELTPGASIVGVDIDPALGRVARDYFGVRPGPRLRTVDEDARVFLRESRDRFDYVVVDLFAGSSLPTHCATAEFFALARARLAPGGTLFLNSNMAEFPFSDGGRASRPVRHLHAALRAAGFRAIFQNDLYEQGHMYAFGSDRSPDDFRRALAAYAADGSRPIEARAEAMADALRSYAIGDRSAFRPFSDDWAPEYFVQRGANFGALLAEGAAGPAGGGMPGDLFPLLSEHFARERRFGVDEARYCERLTAWATGRTDYEIEQLAQSVFVHVPCGAWGEASTLELYRRGLSAVARHQPREGLPLLVEAHDRLSRRRPLL